MHQITLDGVPIAYRQAGSGPPLLLLHGWGGSSRYWQQTLADLSDIRTVYAPDLPGYGESPPREGVSHPEHMAALLMRFADALGLDHLELNGHSFSAGVSVYMTAAYPDRVQRLTLTCPSTYRNERERQLVGYIHRLTGVWMAMRRPWMEPLQLLHRMVAQPFFYRLPNDNTMLRESFSDFLRMDQHTALESAIHAVNPTYNETLQQVAAPTLVVGARQDSIMPRYGPPLVASMVQNGHLAWIERCGHLPMVERASVYNRLLREFLTNDNRLFLELSHRVSHH